MTAGLRYGVVVRTGGPYEGMAPPGMVGVTLDGVEVSAWLLDGVSPVPGDTVTVVQDGRRLVVVTAATPPTPRAGFIGWCLGNIEDQASSGVTCTLPTGVRDGDIAIVYGAFWVPPTGVNAVPDVTWNIDHTYTAGENLGWRIVDGETAYTFTYPGYSPAPHSMVVGFVRGADPDDPISRSPRTSHEGSTLAQPGTAGWQTDPQPFPASPGLGASGLWLQLAWGSRIAYAGGGGLLGAVSPAKGTTVAGVDNRSYHIYIPGFPPIDTTYEYYGAAGYGQVTAGGTVDPSWVAVTGGTGVYQLAHKQIVIVPKPLA